MFFACVALALPSHNAWSENQASHQRQLSLVNLHTEEVLDTVYWSHGNYVQAELDKVNHILRDHRTGDVHRIDPRLLDLLVQLRDVMQSTEAFHVISGYRSPATNKMLRKKDSGIGIKSLHMLGKAIDIRLPGIPLDHLRDAALKLKLGGVGYYPKSSFVHVDVGRVRFW